VKKLARMIIILAIVSWIAAALPPNQPALGAQEGASADRVLVQPGWTTYRNPETGLLRYLGLPKGEGVPPSAALEAGSTPESAARDFLQRYGDLFGVQDPQADLTVMKTSSLPGDGVGAAARSFVRFQQLYQGIPVLGGELIVQLDGQDAVTSASGEILPVGELDTAPQVAAGRAEQIALEKVAKDYDLEPATLTASPAELWIYNPLMLGGPGLRADRLTWRIEVTPLELAPIRELVLVDAALGNIALNFNQVETSRNRTTYTANNTNTLPGTFVCSEGDPSCSAGDAHAQAAHIFAGATYDFYWAQHGRDSFDNLGGTLISTVHYATNYQNAFWNGTQMVYGDAHGYALADDVVAHELTHGVTDRESLLFYFYQSGAINESFSDIWGELVDLYQATGNDAGDTRWDIGEDVSGLGTLRNMMNPTLFGDPDKMSSNLYYCQQSTLGGGGDNGGVHYNSGVGNHAAALMVDGGSFNGVTVPGLGYVKVAKIYYEAQTNLLTSAADYGDLYAALQQACTNLGYSGADCQEVKDALDAVEMNTQPANCAATHAPVCDSGTPTDLFFDNIESGGGNWTAGSLAGTLYWFVPQTSAPANLLPDPYATSGTGNIWGFDQGSPVGGTSNTFLAMNSSVSLPPNAFLHFNHSYGFESSLPTGSTRYDGGILEYSTNNGSSWTDAGGLITHNGYNGILAGSNPLGAIQAFTADSRGYISSRVNLSSLSGQSVRFRFRMGTASIQYDYGWFIDDVRIYTCGTPPQPPAPFSKTSPANAATGVSTATSLSWAATSPVSQYEYCIDTSNDNSCSGWTGSGTNTSVNPAGLIPNTTYYWQARAWNNAVGPTYANGSASAFWSFTTQSGPAPSYVYLPFVTHSFAIVPPAAPTGLAASATGSTSIHLGWTDNANNETGYSLERSPNGTTWAPLINLPANSNSYDDSGLTPSTQYFYRARAFNQHGPSAWSNTANATTQAGGAGVCNGGFEQGGTCWTQFSTHGWTLIVNSGFPGGITPRTGSWAAWLGGDYNDISYVQQQVTVPVGSSYLAYYHWIASSDVCGWDFGGVMVNGNVVNVYDLCSTTNTGGWVKHVVNLAAYAGQTVTLQIRAETDGSANSNLFVDDVAFQATPTSVESATPQLHTPEMAERRR